MSCESTAIEINLNERDRSYRIFINQGLIKEIGCLLAHSIPNIGKKTVIITNSSIGKLYLQDIRKSLQDAGFDSSFIEIKEGETSKSLAAAEKIYKKLISLRADRRTVLLALGGGVIGDLTGFAAATYMRSIPYIQVPTSLLAMVDSSIGGKTGVNLEEGKNLVGAFYQPAAVFIDTNTLYSLPEDELRAGMAEVIKYGIIHDKGLFTFMENNIDNILNLDQQCLNTIIAASCKIKAGVVERDEREDSYRAILNYGHTIGHAIESLTEYNRYKHGEAVSIGMVYASLLSLEMGMCNMEDCERIKNLLMKAGLPVELPELKSEDIINCIYRDKKVIDEKIRFVLTKGIGKVEIAEDIPADLFRKVLARTKKGGNPYEL